MTNTTNREAEIATYRAADEKIAAAWSLYWNEKHKTDALLKAIETNDKSMKLFSSRIQMVEQFEKNGQELHAKLVLQEAVADAYRTAAEDLNKALYTGWSRFFLVKHIHSNQHCSSFRWSTQVGWLPNVSGLTEAEAVAEHGATLCTICFPSAPTELTTKAVDDKVCQQQRNMTGPSRSGYYSGNWGTCECGQTAALTSTGKLRKHNKV